MEHTRLRVQQLKFLETKRLHDRNLASSIISFGPTTTQFYLLLQVGTPPQQTLMALDSGSELAWLQCEPCEVCFNQTSSYNPQVFNPLLSDSYVRMGCSDSLCSLGGSHGATLTCNNEQCMYSIQYVDRSFSQGTLSKDSILLKSLGEVEELNMEGWIFGCGHKNQGRFGGGQSGILGLNKGSLSFNNQLFTQQKSPSNDFGYCFPNRFLENSSSIGFIYFGDSTQQFQLLEIEFLFVKMVENPTDPDFYYIDMVGISVDGKILDIDTSAWQIQPNGTGGTRLDTGTTSFLLSSLVYDTVLTNLRDTTPQMERDYNTESTTGFGLCYKVLDLVPSSMPQLTLHFAGVHERDIVHWDLPLENYFIPISMEDGVFCYALFSMLGINFNIIGNIMVQNHLISINHEANLYAISSLVDCNRLSFLL